MQQDQRAREVAECLQELQRQSVEQIAFFKQQIGRDIEKMQMQLQAQQAQICALHSENQIQGQEVNALRAQLQLETGRNHLTEERLQQAEEQLQRHEQEQLLESYEKEYVSLKKEIDFQCLLFGGATAAAQAIGGVTGGALGYLGGSIVGPAVGYAISRDTEEQEKRMAVLKEKIEVICQKLGREIPSL